MTATNRDVPAPAAAPASDLELRIERLIDAPRELVFRAWTDPEQALRWMGPRGYTGIGVNPERPAPGVLWRSGMRSEASGEELWQAGTYREVVEPERLVFTFAWEGDDGLPEHETLVTITFAERDGKTAMTFHQAFFASKASRDGHVSGWSSAFDRLADLVAPDGAFVLERVFHAPRELVFDAWTRVDHLARWFAPPGCTLVPGALDLRPGGAFAYGVRPPDGSRMYGRWTFREIERPELLVTVVAFTDEAGNVVRHPLSPQWPLETLSTVRFEAREGHTVMTLRWQPLDTDAAGRAAFAAGFASMEAGWKPGLDALAAYVKTLAS